MPRRPLALDPPAPRNYLASFGNMFRASPWISYAPDRQLLYHQLQDIVDADAVTHGAADVPFPSQPHAKMDFPEISTLREEEEETPPPDAGRLNFSKFRVNLCVPARSLSSKSLGDIVGPPVGPSRRMWPSPPPPDSDDEDEEDQLIDDDELAIVTETGHRAGSSPAVLGSPTSSTSPRKRGSATRGRQRRGGITGRRGRPGREPPDAAAMMSTFELNKTDLAGPNSVRTVSPPPVTAVPVPPPQVPAPPTGDWPSATAPKPPRKKPGPKRGSILGPRGPRKNAAKNPQLGSGMGTPILDDILLAPDSSSFLVPAPPSIPPTPGSDQPPLPPHHLPPITAPDLPLDPTIPVPIYPLPTRSFPVQVPPKVPAGYATSHPLDLHSLPPRKWKLVQREVKGIAGGRWFARTWVGEKDKIVPTILRHVNPPPSPPPVPSVPNSQDLPPPLPPTISDQSRTAAKSSHPSKVHRDTSSELESPHSPVGANGRHEPGEGPPVPS